MWESIILWSVIALAAAFCIRWLFNTLYRQKGRLRVLSGFLRQLPGVFAGQPANLSPA